MGMDELTVAGRKKEHGSGDGRVKHGAKRTWNLQENVQVVLKWLIISIILINLKQKKEFEDAPFDFR